MNDFVSFDDVYARIVGAVEQYGPIPDGIGRLYLVRDLSGRVRISASDRVEADPAAKEALQRLARLLHESLGAHGYAPERAVLFVDDSLLKTLEPALEIRQGVCLADRLVTGRDWWSVAEDTGHGDGAKRFTLFSVKGGVGRSTTAAVLAWHLAGQSERVLVVDLDLESPGLSSVMLERGARPEFGVTDWFVEDLVGQGDQVIDGMLARPRWAQASSGDVCVAPAHGREPGEYLAKLGRVYRNTPDPWAVRFRSLLERLETKFDPTIVLLESRSGLHDIAAAAVTEVDALVLLFAVDSASTWTDYGILFQHWKMHRLAASIRDRLSIVSALTPELETERYLQRFREKSWNLFRDGLYGAVEPSEDAGDPYAFDRDEEDAPHVPFPIHWTRGLAAGASLIELEATPILQAYRDFLRRFDGLLMPGNGGGG